MKALDEHIVIVLFVLVLRRDFEVPHAHPLFSSRYYTSLNRVPPTLDQNLALRKCHL